MNCDDVQESLAAYALGILEPGETAAVERHLADCRDHDQELVELRATGMGLALLRPEPEPTAALRARIASIPPAPARAERRPTPLLYLRRPVWAAAAAAALLVVTFGAGWYAGSLPARPAPSTPAAQGTPAAPTTSTERYALALTGTGGQLVKLEGVRGTGAVTVTMQGIAPAPDGRVYQVWTIRDGRWVSLGACNTNENGWWKGDFPATVQTGDEVALTVEPEGGSAKPSGTTLLRAKF